jgi:hypothetical protein
MLNNWVDQLANTRKAASALSSANPKLITAFQGLNAAQNGAGALDAKTRELFGARDGSVRPIQAGINSCR